MHMTEIFMILSLVMLSGLSLLGLIYVVNVEQKVPEKVRKEQDR